MSCCRDVAGCKEARLIPCFIICYKPDKLSNFSIHMISSLTFAYLINYSFTEPRKYPFQHGSLRVIDVVVVLTVGKELPTGSLCLSTHQQLYLSKCKYPGSVSSSSSTVASDLCIDEAATAEALDHPGNDWNIERQCWQGMTGCW